MNFSKFYQKLQFLYEFRIQNSHKNSRTKSKQKEKFVCEISEIRAHIFNKERNLCTNLNKPIRLHQDRHSKHLNWPELMLPIKLFQFKTCELAVTDDA